MRSDEQLKVEKTKLDFYLLTRLSRSGSGGPLGAERSETHWIALFCALKFPDDFRAGVLLAVYISGDRDSTAAVAGNIWGTRLRIEAIPSERREGLQGKEVLERITEDFCLQDPDLPDGETRYPPRF